jgi:hypothetical protein
VTLDLTVVGIELGDTDKTLTPTISPPEATNRAISWTSSDPSIAMVTEGAVRALAVGSTVITVTTADGNKTATCTVQVLPPLSLSSQKPYGANIFNAITSNSDGTKLAAVVWGGYIYTSTDSGVTWTEDTSSGYQNWNSITSSADGTKLAAVAYNGYIYTSTDSGVTWTEYTSSDYRNWYSITSSADGTKLAAVVLGGYIYTSTDSGLTWTERTSSSS